MRGTGNGNGQDDEHDTVLPVPAARASSRGSVHERDTPVPVDSKVTQSAFRAVDPTTDPAAAIQYVREQLDAIIAQNAALKANVATVSANMGNGLARAHAKIDGIEGSMRLMRAELQEELVAVRDELVEVRLHNSPTRQAELVRQQESLRNRLKVLEKQVADARRHVSVTSERESLRDSQRDDLLLEAAKKGLAIAEEKQRLAIKQAQDDAESERLARAMARRKVWKIVMLAAPVVVGVIGTVLARQCGVG